MRTFNDWLLHENPDNYYRRELATLIARAATESGSKGKPDWAMGYARWMGANGLDQLAPMVHLPIVAKLLQQAAQEMMEKPSSMTSWPSFAAEYVQDGLSGMTKQGGRHTGKGIGGVGAGMTSIPYPPGTFADKPATPDSADYWKG